MSINFQQSKTDPIWRGITIQIFSTGSSTCPIRAMLLLWSSGQEGLTHWQYDNLTKPYVIYFSVVKSTIRILLHIVFESVWPPLLLLLGCQFGQLKHWDNGIAMLTCHIYICCPSAVLATVPRILANADPTYIPTSLGTWYVTMLYQALVMWLPISSALFSNIYSSVNFNPTPLSVSYI